MFNVVVDWSERGRRGTPAVSARTLARLQLIKAMTSALVNLPLFRPGSDVSRRRRRVRKYICAACLSAPAASTAGLLAARSDYAPAFCLRANPGAFPRCETAAALYCVYLKFGLLTHI